MVNDIVPAEGAFEFRPTGLIVHGSPTYEEWAAVGAKLQFYHRSIHWLLGDWLNYGEQRYGETYAQALESTDYDLKTLQNAKWVADKIESSRRRELLTFGHHKEIARFDPSEQDYWLDQCEAYQWTVAELRKHIAYARIVQPADSLPQGQFSIIYADPPWRFLNSGFEQSAESVYPTMPTSEICDLPVRDLAAPNAVLFLWAVNAMLADAFEVINAWGFQYKTNIVWYKNAAPGLGWFTVSKHELLLIAVRGETMHPYERPDSVQEFARARHSAKPTEFYELIESMYPEQKYLELFARTQREGWTAWGNEL